MSICRKIKWKNRSQDRQSKWKIRDCCAHMFTDTCLHHNISDQSVTLDRQTVFWASREEVVRLDGHVMWSCLPCCQRCPVAAAYIHTDTCARVQVQKLYISCLCNVAWRRLRSLIQLRKPVLCNKKRCFPLQSFLGRKKTFLLTDSSLVCMWKHKPPSLPLPNLWDQGHAQKTATFNEQRRECCLPLSTPFISSLNKSHCCILFLPRILSDMSQAKEWRTNQQPFFMVTNMNVDSLILTKETCLVCFLLLFCPAHPTDVLFDNPFLPCHKIFQLQAHLVFGHNKNQDFSFFFFLKLWHLGQLTTR